MYIRLFEKKEEEEEEEEEEEMRMRFSIIMFPNSFSSSLIFWRYWIVRNVGLHYTCTYTLTSLRACFKSNQNIDRNAHKIDHAE